MSTNIKLRITAKEHNERIYAVVFMGLRVAVAFSRDSGAKVGYDVQAMLSGNIGSGGSRQNWYCFVEKGSVFELEIDAETFHRNKNRIKKWDMEIIENFTVCDSSAYAMKKAVENLE